MVFRIASSPYTHNQRQTSRIMLLVLLAVQVGLGISNIVAGLPLWVATAHNAGAALLLFTVVGLLARLRAPE